MGEIREKATKASQDGKEVMIIPRSNLEDLGGLDLGGMKIVPVVSVEETLPVAFRLPQTLQSPLNLIRDSSSYIGWAYTWTASLIHAATKKASNFNIVPLKLKVLCSISYTGAGHGRVKVLGQVSHSKGYLCLSLKHTGFVFLIGLAIGHLCVNAMATTRSRLITSRWRKLS